RYRYVLRQGDHEVDGEFRTAPPEDEPATVRFLWSGDLGGGGFCRRLVDGYAIFRVMARSAADFFVFVGDTAYTDIPCRGHDVVPGPPAPAQTVAEYRAHHRYNREDPAFQAFLRRTPVYAIWDDHEVRNNFAGPSEPLMARGRQAFVEYWALAAGDRRSTRLYRRVRWGRLLELFILDTRQYRSRNTERDGPGKTMLGPEQRQWLLDGVTRSTATWKVVVTSVSLSIPTGAAERRDSWTGANILGLSSSDSTGFATERDAILRAFRRAGVRNLVFLAADVHHAELIRHHPHPDWSFHEFVAGPLAATTGRPRPLDVGLGPRSLFAQGNVRNFGEITIEPAHLTVRIVDEQGAELFSHTIGPE
ncbi:MAG TPA: alkaline phosphatase D family protein, partial [Candidatus Tectomicrobia bacterium]|nr:alkaline phosphatase D family protein [Candidatus Tectomicrobia bacterium]